MKKEKYRQHSSEPKLVPGTDLCQREWWVTDNLPMFKITDLTRTKVLELGPRDWSFLCPGLVWWCADDALMMRWWCADDALMMRSWCADDAWVSYLISLKPKLFKNIAHVGSFRNFVFVFVFVLKLTAVSWAGTPQPMYISTGYFIS